MLGAGDAQSPGAEFEVVLADCERGTGQDRGGDLLEEQFVQQRCDVDGAGRQSRGGVPAPLLCFDPVHRILDLL